MERADYYFIACHRHRVFTAQKQEQDWERELVRLKRGRDFDENPDAAYELTEEAKTAGNKTIARLRLLAAQHDYKKRMQTLSDDSSFSPSSLAEAMGAFQVSPSVQEDAADSSPAYETSSETDFEPEYLHEPEFPQTPDIPPKKSVQMPTNLSNIRKSYRSKRPIRRNIRPAW